MRNSFLIICLLMCLQSNAQTAPNLFDKSKMEYKGDKVIQAKLLLRNVKLWGEIVEKEAKLDPSFQSLLNSEVGMKKDQLKHFLKTQKISEQEVGGNIDTPVSFIVLDGKKVYAKYFVIHDVSTPAYENVFPKNINDSTWSKNNLNSWKWPKGKEPSHSIITRTGKSKTLNDFSVGWRATKFEIKTLGIPSRGLFIHIELVQPRKFPPGNSVSAPTAPIPGFTDKQYERLALLYVCASIRKGDWLVPAFHVNVDEKLNDGHDDPQNFEILKFTNEILKIVSGLTEN